MGVERGSPAARAGLRQGDLVTALNGEAVATSRALVRGVAVLPPGETVRLTLLRAGRSAGDRGADRPPARRELEPPGHSPFARRPVVCARTPDTGARQPGNTRCEFFWSRTMPRSRASCARAWPEAGHNVEHADNGRDGLFLAASEPFDILVLDRMLPGGVDGVRLVETLRAQGNRTPVLFLSALSRGR